MVLAWGLTLPAAGLVGAGAWKGASLIGGESGVIIVFLVAAAGAGAIHLASRRSAVTPSNVNDEPTASHHKSPRERVAASAS
jgi:PiT family inorganic phosphate transporter